MIYLLKGNVKKSTSILVVFMIFLAMFTVSGCSSSNTLVLSGTVESTQIDINSETAGKVISIEKEEGSIVKKGEVVAILDSSLQELTVKQQEALVKLKQAKLDDVKAGSRSEQVRQAEADLEQTLAALEQAKLVLSKYRLKSPIDGTLLSTGVNIGDMVNTGSNAGTVSDLTNIWMRVYIPQKYLNSVKLGQQVQLTTTFLKDANIKGEITFISSKAEFTPKNVETSEAKENTVFRIKVKILDHVDQLKPGMTVDAHIPLNN